MIGLVMAGGRGSRMEFPAPEKLLLEYEKPIIFHVIDSLNDSHCFSKVFAATSPNSPDTKYELEQRGIETLDTQGNGYVNDLNFLLQKMDGFVFVVSGDLPLLDEAIIQKLIELNSGNVWTSFLVSKKFLNYLGLKSNLLINYDNIDCVHTGISIVNADKIQNLDPVKENYIILDDKRIAFNLNTKKDYELLSSS
ncbi:NTP transferase domain-containing protein [Marine Group I thaumarchaeote]|uniref:NTP transferase domain-containing protein n=1 Tax=Marine Group I thaumarchaeote TaxID=2511932 RepID=A0A7K4NTJ8_9ARCH|nr:NTP transferase domain-containing protein [Marine Group I thaumarchaeote]